MLREDKWMNTRNNKLLKCLCNGYAAPHFPPRRGSRFCYFRKDGTRRLPGDPDFHDQQLEWEKDHGRNPVIDVPEPPNQPASVDDGSWPVKAAQFHEPDSLDGWTFSAYSTVPVPRIAQLTLDQSL